MACSRLLILFSSLFMTCHSSSSGFATRYWDCCKAHCSWQGNTYGKSKPLPTCSKSNVQQSGSSIKSACEEATPDSAFACFDNVPWSVSNTLAYGFAAVPAEGDICGKCFELSFHGQGKDGANAGAAALNGKKMIVQATNIGHDVAGGQFDIMFPGGGVGIFDACSYQFGVPKDQMGAQYGGFLTACQQQFGWNEPHSVYKSCVLQKCESVFGTSELAHMKQGCSFFANWYEVADNPTLTYREVACPEAIVRVSGMDRGGSVPPAPPPPLTTSSPSPQSPASQTAAAAGLTPLQGKRSLAAALSLIIPLGFVGTTYY